MSLPIPELTSRDFQRISVMTRRVAGIDLHSGKEGLVISRLMRRMGLLGTKSFKQYIDYVENDASGQELTAMVDALTTNKTSFFRESQHFDYLRARVIPELRRSPRPFTVWSAGCSTGQEPYSLAILFKEELPLSSRNQVRILATDISRRVVEIGLKGRYDRNQLEGMTPALLKKYFSAAGEPGVVEINPDVRAMVTFAKLNLMKPWPMKGAFDLILCRNVMIYFDRPTQQNLTNRFASILRPGGYLFIGHAETISGGSGELAYVQPAVNCKEASE